MKTLSLRMADKEEKQREKEAKLYSQRKREEIERRAKRKKKKHALKTRKQKRELYEYLSNVQEEREITVRLIEKERLQKKKIATGATLAYPCECSFACNYLSIVRDMKKSYRNLYANYQFLFDQYLHLFNLELPNYEEDTDEEETLLPMIPRWRKIMDGFFSIVFYPRTKFKSWRKAFRRWIMRVFGFLGPQEEENVSNMQQPVETGLQIIEEPQMLDMGIYGNLKLDWDIWLGKKDAETVRYYRQLGKIYCEMKKLSKAQRLLNTVLQFLYLEKTCICIHCGAMTDCELYAEATNELYQEYCDVYSDYLALWFATSIDFDSSTTRTLRVHEKYDEMQSEVQQNKIENAMH